MLLRRTPSGRRSAVTAASAAALCLASALTACGGGGGGYTAVGTGPGTPGPPSGPTGSVTLFPLDGSPAGTPHGAAGADGGPAAGTVGAPTGGAATTTSPPVASPGHSGTGNRRSDAPEPDPPPSAPSSPAPTSPTSPAAPADLTWSTPVREATDKRWCEKVTVGFRNTGGTAVRSGTITLGTHIIGALGVDWATIASTRPLPVPVAPRSRGSGTWTVCVDDWRVPLGMHVETRIVTVDWS
ncbi:hypothetical protein [Streptomyces sp. NPDC051014]|uniref:hypothetical protein n=1 Tax=Streptomyces sp. NPDC051014 TaxID=3155751 RepID=UPI0033DBC0A8